MQKESLIKKVVEAPQPKLNMANSLTSSVREPLPTIQTYCQSKTFIATHGINGLIASASALFSLLSKLRELPSYKDIEGLKKGLVHEVKAFECAALNRGYTEQQIIIARYAICATLDDTILHTAWGTNSNWREDTLLYIFQGEMWGGERLFTILEHLRTSSKEHVELLEFIYVCMNLGFEGKYRVNEKDKDSFYSILDMTYRMIRNTRGDFPERLSKIKYQKTPEKIKKKKKSLIMFTLLFSCGLILGVYFLFNLMLQETAKPVLAHVQQIENSLS